MREKTTKEPEGVRCDGCGELLFFVPHDCTIYRGTGPKQFAIPRPKNKFTDRAWTIAKINESDHEDDISTGMDIIWEAADIFARELLEIPESEDFEWDGEHCPFCRSQKIHKYGDSVGQDTGDEGIDYDYWRCKECESTWQAEQDGA